MEDNQETLLQQPLDPAAVQHRTQAGRQVDYLEGWFVIAQANRIFGFLGWSTASGPVELHEVGDRAFYTAKVAVYLDKGDGTRIIREDIGVCAVEQRHNPDGSLEPATLEAHDTACKGAVTDALKRCLRTFGNQFGNSLYDREHSDAPVAKATQEPGAQAPICPKCHIPYEEHTDGTRRWWSHKTTDGIWHNYRPEAEAPPESKPDAAQGSPGAHPTTLSAFADAASVGSSKEPLSKVAQRVGRRIGTARLWAFLLNACPAAITERDDHGVATEANLAVLDSLPSTHAQALRGALEKLT